MLKPYNVNAVLKNIESVFKHQDIKKLNNTGYHFLYLMSGFIAHYDLYGFQNAYTDLLVLLEDISGALPIERDCAVRNIDDVAGAYNGYGLPYCKSELDIITGLGVIVKKYYDKTREDSASNKDNKFELIKEMVKRGETDDDIKNKLVELL